MEMEDLADKMRERVSASDFKGSVKFDCGSDGAILIDGNSVSLSDAVADCIIALAKSDLEAMLAGELDPTSAFMQGKIRVDGDFSVAMQLNQVL